LAPGEQMVPAATAVAASAAAAAASGVVTEVADATPIAIAAAPASAPEPSAPPLDAEPTLGRVVMPSLGPMLDNPQSQAARAKRQAERVAWKQTQQESQQHAQKAAALAAARLAPPKSEPAEPPAPVVAKVEPPVVPKAPAGVTSVVPSLVTSVATTSPIGLGPNNANNANTGPFYALATRRLRTTAESEQLAAAMRSLLGAVGRAPGGVPLRVDTLAEGKDWRVVSWPYSSRSSAEQARAQLVARGLKVDVVDF
jgi:hypothetical protein